MHSEFRGLLAGVLAEPQSDAPRLVLADWWEEHGQEERAELVRVQCQLAKPMKADWIPSREDIDRYSIEDIRLLYDINNWGPTQLRDALRRRERELLEKHCRKWTALIPGFTIDAYPLDEPMIPYFYGARCRFHRGFITEIALLAIDWLQHTDALYWHPSQERPCPETAQPLERVQLKNHPVAEDLDRIGIAYSIGDLYSDILNRNWPHIRFELPSLIDAHWNDTPTDVASYLPTNWDETP